MESPRLSSATMTPVITGQPATIVFQETSGKDVSAVLFGYNDCFVASNFGNPSSTVITGEYAELVRSTSRKPLSIKMFRFKCSDIKQLQQTITIVKVDANGSTMSRPIILPYYVDPYQQFQDVLDVACPVIVDANTSLTFTLRANATLSISMFESVYPYDDDFVEPLGESEREARKEARKKAREERIRARRDRRGQGRAEEVIIGGGEIVDESISFEYILDGDVSDFKGKKPPFKFSVEGTNENGFPIIKTKKLTPQEIESFCLYPTGDTVCDPQVFVNETGILDEIKQINSETKFHDVYMLAQSKVDVSLKCYFGSLTAPRIGKLIYESVIK